MAHPDEKQLEESLNAFMEAVERNSKASLMVSQTLAANSEVFIKELRRFRACEALLYLFFARYYIEKADPIAAATFDRDFLAGQHRKYAQDEAGAQDIEHLYDPIFTYINAGLEAKHSRVKSEDRVM